MKCVRNMKVAVLSNLFFTIEGYPSESSDDKLPSFMLNMHRKLSSSDTHKNVRIFIARLIVNCASSFKSEIIHIFKIVLLFKSFAFVGDLQLIGLLLWLISSSVTISDRMESITWFATSWPPSCRGMTSLYLRWVDV